MESCTQKRRLRTDPCRVVLPLAVVLIRPPQVAPRPFFSTVPLHMPLVAVEGGQPGLEQGAMLANMALGHASARQVGRAEAG